jgi:uncharacterized protein (TIGR02147 family)
MTIFEHSDYRNYLRSHIRHLPHKGRGELTRIATHLSVNTTLLSQIMSGTREFTPEQTHELSVYLGHTDLETEYFSLLTQHERAGTKSLKTHLQKKLEATKKEAMKLSKRIAHDKTLSTNERAVFYSSWIYSAIHLFTSTNDDGVSLDEMASRFEIPRVKAAEIAQFLTSCGLCVEKSGQYKIGVQSTFLPKTSPFLNQHHANWRVKSFQKIDNIAENEMMYTGQVSLSKKDFNKIREQLVQVLKSAMAVVKDSPADDIACLNIDWFWLTK